jgi:hypothetical protein
MRPPLVLKWLGCHIISNRCNIWRTLRVNQVGYRRLFFQPAIQPENEMSQAKSHIQDEISSILYSTNKHFQTEL